MRKPTVIFAILVFVAAASATALAVSEKDQEFVTKAAQGGMFEVAAGEIASERAGSEEVKEFGRLMVSDHGQANAKLRGIAETEGFDFPNDMGDKYQKKIDKLNDASNDEFDRKYMELMAEDHKEDVEKFRKMQDKVENPELKAWVSETLTVLEGHKERAKTLKSAVKE